MSSKHIQIPLTNANGVTVLPEMWNQFQNMMAIFKAHSLSPAPVTGINEPTLAASVASLPSLLEPSAIPLPSPKPKSQASIPTHDEEVNNDNKSVPNKKCHSQKNQNISQDQFNSKEDPANNGQDNHDSSPLLITNINKYDLTSSLQSGLGGQ